MVDYEVPTKFDTARLVLEEKTFEEYPGMMHRTMTIFLAPHDHMDVYLSNHKYTVQQEATKVIGVDTVPFPVSWTVKMKKKQKETQDILSYHTQAAGCSDKARAKASGGRQPIEECGRTGL